MNQQTNHQRTNRRLGFTLIELMLAMTFVSVLLLTIAMTILQMGTIYNRGMTLKEVNQAARNVADDLRRVVAASEIFNVTTSDGSSASDYAVIRTMDSNPYTVGGRLCTGSYSYLWNTGLALEATAKGSAPTDVATYIDGSGTKQFARLLKVPDVGKKYCARDTHGALVARDANPNASTGSTVPASDGANATELLQAGDHNLNIENFSVTTSDSSFDSLTMQRTYTVSYTIGSGDTSAMNSDQSACLPPNDPSGNSNLTYCNVQQFSIVLRVGNTVN